VGVACVIAGDIRTLSAGANRGQIGSLFADVRGRILAAKRDQINARNPCAAALTLNELNAGDPQRTPTNNFDDFRMPAAPAALRAMFGKKAHKLHSPQGSTDIRFSLHTHPRRASDAHDNAQVGQARLAMENCPIAFRPTQAAMA
jgi:hypothetical protein